MAIIVNKHGHRLNSFEYINDIVELKDVQGMWGGNAILIYKGKLLVCWNKYRNNWELPGGGKEKGEDLTQSVIREIYEETSQRVEDLKICCTHKVFIPRMKAEIVCVTFYGELKAMTSFTENEEISKIALWDMKTDVGDMDAVDVKIVDLILNKKE